MTPCEVFSNPELCERSEAISIAISEAMTGQYVAVALSALFCAFVGLCRQAEMEPGAEWEAMISLLEGRKTATHDAHRSLQ